MVIYTVVYTCTVRPGQCKIPILLKSKSTSVNEGIYHYVTVQKALVLE